MNTLHKSLIVGSFISVLTVAALSGTAQPAQAESGLCDVASARQYVRNFQGNTIAKKPETNRGLSGQGMNIVQITNTSTDCTYPMGAASYKAFEHSKVNLKSQVLYSSKTIMLKPGQSWTYTIPLPECVYQTDLFYGQPIHSFANTSYTGEGRLFDAYFSTDKLDSPDYCKNTPTPTPTPSPTPTPTPTPSPTPTPHVPTPTPVVTPTPTPTVTPQVLPATGPGAAIVIALFGMVGGLIGHKSRLF